MKWRKFAVAALVAATLVPVTAEADDISNNNFRISLPSGFPAFTEQTQKTKVADGVIDTTNWIARSPQGEVLIVTLCRMPAKILDRDKLAGNTHESLLKSLSATIESEEKTSGANPANVMLFKTDKSYFKSKLIVGEDRFLQLIYVGHNKEDRDGSTIRAVFDSFAVENAVTETASAQP